MSDETTLLPCPFCGGEARHYEPGPIEHHIECTNPKCYAVTHGWSTEVEAIAAWNTRAAHGTLTAEQVSKAVYAHSIHADCADADWQAIADELNAALGGGECENVAPDYLDFLCSKCGFVHYHSDENDAGDGNDWNYCPNCGKAVKR